MVEVITEKKDKKVLWLLLALVILLCAAFLLFLFSKGLVLGGDSVRLVEMRPAGEVELRANLTFAFSKPVVAEEEVGKTIDRPLVFHPGGPEIPVGLPEGTAFSRKCLSGLPLPTVQRLTRPLPG